MYFKAISDKILNERRGFTRGKFIEIVKQNF